MSSEATPVIARQPVRAKKNSRGKWKLPLLFLGPAVALVILVNFFPVIYAFMYTLYKTKFLERTGFAGLSHYITFLQDPEGRNAVTNSLVFTIGSLALALPLGTAMALILNRQLWLKGMWRTFLIVPWVVSQLITALLWAWLANYQFGPIPYFVKLLFGTGLDLLGSPKWAMPTLILANVWQSFPYAMLMILAALQTIPGEVMEAAVVDGANSWRRLWNVVLPMIRSTLLITTIMLTIHYFNMVTMPMILTNGGPVGKTDTMSLLVYREAFSFFHMGYATTVAMYMFFFNIVFSLIYIRVLKTEAFE